MQIPRSSPTNSSNYVKFAPFIDPLYLMFQIHAIAENCLKFQRIRQISLNLPADAANYAKFTESAPMTSRLGVNPGNSRNVQQMMQVLRLSHNALANNAKFATFANKTQDK